MTNKVNKHITDPDELFKRLESGDESGLDDFEKEALEGFASLGDKKLAQDLNDGLTSRIDQTYFKKEPKGNSYWFLATAAGLVLIIGLSIFFFNYMGKQADLAMNKEAQPAEQEMKPQDIDAAPENTITKSENEEGSGAKQPPPPPAYENTISGEPVVEKALAKEAKITSRSIPPMQPKTKIEVSGNTMQVASSTGKNAQQPISTVASDEEQKNSNSVAVAENAPAYTAMPVMDKLAEADQQSQTPGAGGSVAKRDEAKKEENSKNKKASVAPNRSVPAETENDEKSNVQLTMAGNQGDYKNSFVAQGPTDDRNRNDEGAKTRSNEQHFSSAQEYVKAEFEKNTELKTKVKTFKANLTIEANGIISRAELLTEIKDCADCQQKLKTILLNIPADQGLKLKGKEGKNSNVVEFVYP